MPSRIVSDILTIPRSINKVYSYVSHGYFVQRLSTDELDETELPVLIESGSGRFISDLVSTFNSILSRSIDHKSRLMVLCIVALIGSAKMWGLYLEYKTDLETREHYLQMSKQETERLDMIREILLDRPEYQDIVDSMFDTVERTSRRLDDDDVIRSGGRTILRGYDAKEIARHAYRTTRGEQVASMFSILSVSSGSRSDDFGVLVRDIQTGEKYRIIVPQRDKLYRQQRTIRRAEWEKSPIWLRIQVIEERPRVSRAALIDIRRRPPKSGGND